MRVPRTLYGSMVWLHKAGLVCLPNYYDSPWKTNLHRVYSAMVVGFLILYMVSMIITLLFYCTRDFSEFCEKFFEWIVGMDSTSGIVFVKMNIGGMIKLLEELDEFGYYHRRNEVLVNWKRRTERIVSLGWKFQISVVIGMCHREMILNK